MQVECAHDELVDIDLLIPNPKNPNHHPDNQIILLAKIMKHQGWRSPIVVSNRSGFIIKGHGRLLAARLNGWQKVPIDRQDYGTEADEYADMVADNKIAELSTSDMNMILEEIKLLGDFDLDLLGIEDFKAEEVKELTADDILDQKHIFEVVVTCANESEQEQIYNRLTEEGLDCRVLSM